MNGMKLRYEVMDMTLRISNVTLPEGGQSYVLITASDTNNEIVFQLSHDQAQNLEYELFEANRRWREHFPLVSNQLLDGDAGEEMPAQ